MKSMLRFALPVIVLMTATLHGQQAAGPVYTQTLSLIKVAPGKGADYEQLASETSKKVAQVRANAGEIVSWTLLRSVLPAGQEARADYIISVISEGAPPAPTSRGESEERMKKAGVSISYKDYLEKRRALTTLVAVEMWRPRERVAAPQKGHYVYMNYMKVKDVAAYNEFEHTVWRPLAEAWVKQGAMSGWVFATKMLPAGTETPYGAFSADIYPTWSAVFATRPTQATFEKVHPGKNYEKTFEGLGKLRELARRELWVVVDRVEKTGGANKATE
jgi:hypothetical protein